jgi:hypothetical protein
LNYEFWIIPLQIEECLNGLNNLKFHNQFFHYSIIPIFHNSIFTLQQTKK